jgi:hypothetical protein
MELVPDYTTPYHRIWLALDDLIDGDGREASGWLDGLDPAGFDETNQYLLELARLLLQRSQAGPAGRDAVLRSTSRHLAAVTGRASIPPEDHGAVVQTYHRVVRRMAADRGLVGGFPWRIARQLQAPRRRR